MTRVRVVGLLGAMGAGKSTVAEHMEQAHGFIRLRLADPIKEMMLPLGLTWGQVYGGDKTEPVAYLGGRSSRYAQQTLGTEWGRQTISQDIWVLQLARRIDELADGSRVVVDDVRFPNEAHVLREWFGARLYTVRRPEVEFAKWRQRALRRFGWWVGGPLGIHESERGWVLIPTPVSIFNMSTTENLCRAVDQQLEFDSP